MASELSVTTYELSNWRRDWQSRFLVVGYARLSPSGDRIAAPVRDAHGWTIAVNGEPWADRWASIGRFLDFSDNGGRVAVAVQDKLGWTVAVDGETWWTGFSSEPRIVLSPNGTRVAAEVWSRRGYTVYVDQERWPEYYGDVSDVTFDPTGRAVAAVVEFEDPDAELKTPLQRFGDRKMTIVVDGTNWPGIFQSCWVPVFSPDGQHVATTVTCEQGATVAVDGGCWDEHFEAAFSCAFSPEGTHVAACVNREGRWTVAVDGEPWMAWFETKAEWPCFSPDGQHVLAQLWEYEAPNHVVVDGRIWRPEFVEAAYPCFSPTTSEVAGAVKDEKGWTVATTGGVWPQRFLEVGRLKYSPNGRHMGVEVKDSRGWTVAVEGEPLPVRYLRDPFAVPLLPNRIEDWGWGEDSRSLWLVGRDSDHNWIRTEATI